MKKKLGLYALITLALAGVGASFSGVAANNIKEADAADSAYFFSVDSEFQGGNKSITTSNITMRIYNGSWGDYVAPNNSYNIRGRNVYGFPSQANTVTKIQFIHDKSGWNDHKSKEITLSDLSSRNANTFSIWEDGNYANAQGSWFYLNPSNPAGGLTTPGRIYIDGTKLGDSTSYNAIYFYGDMKSGGSDNYIINSSYTESTNRTVAYDTYYNNSSTPTARNIGICTIPWNATSLRVETSNGTMTKKSFDSDPKKNLLVLYKVNSTVYGEWREPEIGIDDYMYVKLNDDTSGEATTFGLQHANSGTIKALFYNNYYISTYNPDPVETSGSVVKDSKTNDYYLKIPVPDWSVAVKLKDGGSTTGDPIQLIANKNVYYDVTGVSYTLAGHAVNNFDATLAPSADNARVYIAPQLSGTWNIDSTSYKFGVQWWYGDTEPTDIFSYNVSLVTKLTDSLDGRSDIIYGYCDIPKIATKIRVVLYLKSGNNYYPSYRSSTIITVQNSTFSNFHVVTPATNSDYYCTTSLGNNADHHLGAPGPTILSNILEAYSTCDSSPYNGYGNGKELCENFYLDGASSATLNTLARCRGGYVDYTIGAHFATLYNKDTAHSSVEEVDEALAPYYAPNIEIQNSSNSTTLIVIICGVSVIALVSVTLLLAFSKKKKSE